jgi:pimeloyl-ACP methyl ester carboxylesterase
MSNYFSWNQFRDPYRFEVGSSSKDYDTTAFLNPDSQSSYIISGIGGRVHNQVLVMLELQIRPINSDGTLGARESVKFGPEKESSTGSEIFVSLQDNQVAVGVGLKATDDDLSGVWVYYRNWNPNLGVLDTTSATGIASSGGSPEQIWYVDDSQFSSDELEITVLTGVAGHCSSDSDITRMACQVGQIQYRMAVDDLPAGSPSDVSEKRALVYDEEDAYAFSLMLSLAPIADDAYRSIESNDYFEQAFDRIDGQEVDFGSKDSWLSSMGYSLIQDTTYSGDDLSRKYWGVIGTYRYELDGESVHALVVAFRGTATWEDLAVDLDGAGAGVKLSLPQILQTRATFWVDQWTVQNTTMNVHRGFLSTYRNLAAKVRQQVMSAFDTDTSLNKLFIIGHSLGGGLANLCAVDFQTLSSGTIPKPTVVTYAAPKVGDDAFVNAFNNAVDECYAAYHQFDLVPYIPYWYDTTTISPIITGTGYFGNVRGARLIPSSTWFPTAHMLGAYYRSLSSLSPSPLHASGLTGTDRVTQLSLTIQTGTSLGAGTDCDIYVIFGDGGDAALKWGPLDISGHNDFERGDRDTYELTPVPSNLFVNDLYGKEVTFMIPKAGVTNIFTSSWQITSVDIKVNNQLLCTLDFNNDWLEAGLGYLARKIGYEGMYQ